MSEADDRRELSGLARSIDALFTRGPAGSSDVREPLPLPVVEEEPPPSFGEEPQPLFDDEPEPSFAEEPPEAEVAEATEPEAESPAPPPLRFEFTATDSESGPESVEEPPDVAGPPPLPAEEAAPSDGGEPPSDPAELTLAVDALLAGEAGAAERVEGLAGDLSDRLALEPLADAAERIAREAGEPPDARLLAAAQAITNPAVASRLVQRIGHERDEGRRAEYAMVCRRLGPIMAKAFRGALTDTANRDVRGTYHQMLIAMGDASRPIIEEMVEDENGLLVGSAVTILGETGGERAVELVTSALANPDARVRRAALASLAKLGDEEAGTLVVGFMEDPDAEVRLAAATAAGHLRVDRALRPLLAMLDGESDPDRLVPLIRALGELGDPGAVPAIEKHAVRTIFSKPPAEVRVEAYRALQQIGTPHARDLVTKALSDKEVGVRAAVRRIVETSS